MRKHRSSPSRASSDALELPLEVAAASTALPSLPSDGAPDLRLVAPEGPATPCLVAPEGPATPSGDAPVDEAAPATLHGPIAEVSSSEAQAPAAMANVEVAVSEAEPAAPVDAVASTAEAEGARRIESSEPALASEESRVDSEPALASEASRVDSEPALASEESRVDSEPAPASEESRVDSEPAPASEELKVEAAPPPESAKYAKAVVPPSVVEESSINYDDEGLLELELDDMQYRFDAGKQGTALCLSVRELGTYRWSSVGELKWDGRDLRSKAVDRKLLGRLSLALREYSQAQGE